MRLFVYSFGTIEFIDGIIVVDTDLNYKTFEKEYREILNQIDKDLKKIIRNIFEKGEYEVKNPNIEKKLLTFFEKLEQYDNPSFKFMDTLQPPKETSSPSPLPELEELETNLEEEPEILEEPPIIDSQIPLDKESLQSSIASDVSEPKMVETSDDLPLPQKSDTLTPADLQDALSSMDLDETIEEPPVIEEELEEIPVSDVEAQATGIISSFIVQMTEEAEFKLDHDCNIKKAESTGKILLKNAGQKDRIWDINLKLGNIKSTSLKEDIFHINELAPGKAWEKSYKVKKQKALPISFSERIDTFTEIPEEIHTLIPNQKTTVEFSFEIENTDKHDIINLKMEKKLPKQFTDLKLAKELPPKTEFKIQDHVLLWKILNLKPKQKLSLKIRAIITPTSIDPVKTGPIKISFTKLNAFYSDILLEDVSSISKNIYYIEKDEEEKSPNQWNCRLIFQNRSEFPILLESAEIFSGDITSDKKITVFRAINEIIRPSDNEWISKDWTVFSEEIPTFGKKLHFKIIPSTTKTFTAHLTIEETELPILWAEVRKEYSLLEVASYTKTPVTITITLTNKGGADINELTIKDFIPEDFIPPSINDIKLYLDETEINKTNQKLELSIKRIPDSDDEHQPHQIIFQLLNLQDSIGPIKKNSTFKIQYSVSAINPPPEKTYSFPVAITCNTYPKGASLNITPDMVENSEITVTHERRKLTIGKSVFPGAEEGEYEITIIFKNRGNTEIKNATISDLVPTNFRVLTSTPEANIQETETKILLEWQFNTIKPGESIEISYKIKGSGEYKTSDAEILYKA